MSIETEFQSTIQNVQNAYNGLNNLGATIPQNKTIENIKSCLDEIYDNLPKTEYQEGTEVNLGKTIKGKLDYDNGVVGIGQCEQNGEPTPSTPTDIQCVTGNQNVVVSGKNLLNFSIEGQVPSVSSGQLVSSPNGACTDLVVINNSKSYVLKWENNTNVTKMYAMLYRSNETYIGYQEFSSAGTYMVSNITGFNDCYYLRIRVDSRNNYKNAQLEQGSTATTYEPYITPTSYQLSLGDIELNAIGDYKDELIYDVDEDRVYKKANIKSAILNSTNQTWETQSTNVTTKKRYSTNAFASEIVAPSISSNLGILMCNYYGNQVAGTSGSYGGNQGVSISSNGSIYVNDSRYDNDIDGWKTWLNSVICKVYYALQTPVETEITDTTLINQVKSLYNAHSLNGTTIITSNGNLPMIIKVRGLKGE